MEEVPFDSISLEVNLRNASLFVEGEAMDAWWRYVYNPDTKHGFVAAPYKQIGRGWLISVGRTLVNNELVIETWCSFNFDYYYGKLVCFYHPTSARVDWDHIETYLRPYWTTQDGSYGKKTNMKNFDPSRLQ